MSETLINALVKAQQKVNDAVQDSNNPFFKSDYASLKSVLETVKPVFNAEGIYIQQVAHENESGVSVETIFMGHGGSVSSGKVPMPAPKNDPQGFGSALTYAKRYSLQMACGIATQKEDDDAEKAMKDVRGFAFKGIKGNDISYSVNATLYLKELRKMLKDPENKDHQKLFNINVTEILKAQESLDKESEDYSAYQQLRDLYSSG